ncbi:MAG: site-specific integrase [Candidatus Bathyarchaeota archaeon]|nr:site-specific integrase [Candidatus Bathyarchaeota archaeon]
MQTLTKTDIADINELQKLIEEAETPREKATRRFIIEAFKGKMRSLIPFAIENESVQNIAGYRLKYTKSQSKATLYNDVFSVRRFCKWLRKSPDSIISEVKMNEKTIDDYINEVDAFIGDLQVEDLASGTINNYVKGVKTLFRTNGLTLVLPYRIPKYVKYPDRAPTPKELFKVIDIAPIKGKTVVSILALSGIRIGTLVKLTYGHVRQDLEAGIAPVHIHVEAEITKGKYGAYDTFLGAEAIQYLKAYLDMRRQGTEKIPPEVLTDDSPLIRNECRNVVIPVSGAGITTLVHKLLFRASIIVKGEAKRYCVRPHSIRKYFKTQLEYLRTIPTEYIEYMMGHRISIYNSIAVEQLRNLYASSGLSIRPKTQLSKIERLKMFAESLGLNPDEVLTRDALVKPHRTVVDPESRKIEVLNDALKHAILMELRTASQVYATPE